MTVPTQGEDKKDLGHGTDDVEGEISTTDGQDEEFRASVKGEEVGHEVAGCLHGEIWEDVMKENTFASDDHDKELTTPIEGRDNGEASPGASFVGELKSEEVCGDDNRRSMLRRRRRISTLISRRTN